MADNRKKSDMPNSKKKSDISIKKKKNAGVQAKGTRPPFIVVNGANANFLKTLNEYIIVSVDPGQVNLGFRIEKRTRVSPGSNYCKVETLEMCVMSIPWIYSKNSVNVYSDITKLLDSFSTYYPWVCLYIVEQQQIPQAYQIIRISQHIIGYFTFKAAVLGAVVAEVCPKSKTRFFNAPKMERPERVKWGVNKGLELLHANKDILGLSKYHQYIDKVDDIMVTIIQVEAIFKYLNLPLTEDSYTGNFDSLVLIA